MEIISIAFMKGYDGLRFRAQDIDNEVYYQLPKGLFSYKFYHGLDIKAKVLYAVLKDRMNLSRKNGWVEENGDIFLMFSYGDLALLLGMSKTAVFRAFQKLGAYGLVETVPISKNGAQKIYINRIETPSSMADVHDYEDRLGRAEVESVEDEAKNMVADAYTAGVSMTLTEAREKAISKLKETRSADVTACSVLETPCSANGTPRSADETACSVYETGPVPPAELSKANLYNKTNLEILNKEKNTTTTTTGAVPAVAGDNESIQKIICSYRDNISPMVGPVVIKELTKLCEEYGSEQVSASITEAALSAKGEVNVRYLGAILRRWQKENEAVSTRTVENHRQESAEPEENNNVVYDGDGKPMPDPLPGENAQEYFERVGIF